MAGFASIVFRFALVVWTCGVVATYLHADDDAPKRLAVPSDEAQAKATSLIKSIFKVDYADHSSAARGRLASKLQQQAEQTSDDQTARFVLLRESRDAFAHDGAVRDAVRVGRQMEAEFAIAGVEAQVSAVAAAHGAAKSPEAEVDLANAAIGVAEAALRENNAEGAAKAIREAEIAVPHKNSALAVRAQAVAKRVHAAQQSAEVLDAAVKKLRAEPEDRQANLTVGKALCFEQDRWESGLPLLERAGDPSLAGILQQERENPSDAAHIFALADAWWDLPEKTGISKAQSQQRACFWYRRVLDQTTGLRRTLAQQRISQAEEKATLRTIDLLALVDPVKDAVSGSWKIDENGLAGSQGDVIRIEIPFEPPDEYDFRVIFARTSGDSYVLQIARSGESGFFFEGESHGYYLGMVAGPKVMNRLLMFPDAVVKNAHKYTSVVSVRKNRITFSVDGKLIGSLQRSDYQMQGQDVWTLRNATRLGVGVHRSTAIFYNIEVTEISGRGRILP